ncbi:MAG: hypothetical protein GX634_09140 [Lentisphaerae bacterium]|nr:hypothetical protein [Lentisphaerota bacterium]
MKPFFLLVSTLAMVWASCAWGAPVRVSFLDTDPAREDTLRAFAEAGCDSANLDALRDAIVHYYREPPACDTSLFPPADNGFYEFASIGDFLSALGTNQLSYLDHPFELNCFDTALLLAAQGMSLSADLNAPNGPYLAVQVTTNFSEWLMPVASLADVYATAHPAWYGQFMENRFGLSFTEKHRSLVAALYQYQALPLDTSPNTVAAETQAALRRHWKRCGIRFPTHVSLVMLHRASPRYHLVVTDHMGVLLKRETGGLYLEQTGGRGPFLRIDVKNPADIAAYLSTVTWPDYPFNYMSANDDLILDVPLRPAGTPAACSTSIPAASSR